MLYFLGYVMIAETIFNAFFIGVIVYLTSVNKKIEISTHRQFLFGLFLVLMNWLFIYVNMFFFSTIKSIS